MTEVACLSRCSFLVPDHIVQSAWLEHAPFLFWLLENLAPRDFVELGTHTGFSYFAACQLVKTLDLSTSCHAVDSWQGDEHAGFYGEPTFQAVLAVNGQYASFSNLIRADFAKGVKSFADGSIDLLHIDGRHFYEDAKNDFELWRPKVREGGIVLFHDTQVRERDFGVWRLFGELRSAYPSFEFTHCNGLGILALGSMPPRLLPLFSASLEEAETIRLAYASLGANITARWRASVDIAELSKQNALLTAELEPRRDAETRSLAGLRKPVSSIELPKSLRGFAGRFSAKRHLRRDYVTLARSPLFDRKWYLAEYPKAATEAPDPILHYLEFGGEFVGLSPSAHFDARLYVEANPDVREAKANPLLHFLKVGAREGRCLRPVAGSASSQS